MTLEDKQKVIKSCEVKEKLNQLTIGHTQQQLVVVGGVISKEVLELVGSDSLSVRGGETQKSFFWNLPFEEKVFSGLCFIHEMVSDCDWDTL